MRDEYRHLHVDRLNIPVTRDFHQTVKRAANAGGLTIADYARAALTDRLQRDGFALPVRRSPVHGRGVA